MWNAPPGSMMPLSSWSRPGSSCHSSSVSALVRCWAFLLVGVGVGPFGIGRLVEQADWVRLIPIEDPESVAPFAEWGVIFLLFPPGA